MALTYHSEEISSDSPSALGARCGHRRSLKPFFRLDVKDFSRIELSVIEASSHHEARPWFIHSTTRVCTSSCHGSQFPPIMLIPVKQRYTVERFLSETRKRKMGKRLNRTKTIDCRFRRTIVRFYYSFTHLTSIVRRSFHQNDHLDGLMSCHEAKIFSSKQTRVSIQNGKTIDHFVAFGLVKEKVGQKGWKPLKVGSNHCKAKPLRNYFRRFKFKYILGTSKINQRLEKCVPNVLLLYN